MCNLTEAVVRPDDTYETLARKIKVASIMGTWQSTLTKFRYLSKQWVKNTEDERLLGVSLTGIMDHPIMNGSKGHKQLTQWLDKLKEHAVDVNKELATTLGIPQSTAITAIKPSGTVSQLVDSASGIHARHNPYYIRTVRADVKDPLAQFMSAAGFPVEPDFYNKSNLVFSFPMKAPEGSVFRTDRTAIEQLELWKIYQEHWCEHKPSITVSVKEDEWMHVGAWVYENFDMLSGVSFLPFSDHTYMQAPYQDCTKEEYEAFKAKMPVDTDWSQLAAYEMEDNTTGSQELACVGMSCEL